MNNAITITFGETAAQERLGTPVKNGLTTEQLSGLNKYFQKQGFTTSFINLGANINQDATILIVSSFLPKELAKDIWVEQANLEWDQHMKLRGAILNRLARYTLSFGYCNHDPDYKEGLGRIINFTDVPLLNSVRNGLETLLDFQPQTLFADGICYYNSKKCHLPFHGADRKLEIALHLGDSYPYHFQWFKQNRPISNKITFLLKSGDLYFLNEKATGYDWKRKLVPTLRHAAGNIKTK